MMSEIIIRNGDRRRPMNCIDQPVGAIRQRAMVDPNIPPAKNGDAVAIRLLPPPCMARGIPNIGIPRDLAVVDVDPMNDYVSGVVDGDARPVGDVDADAAAVDGFMRVHHELVFQANDHVAFEDDPEWLVLDDSVAESARSGVDRVIVARVGHSVYSAVSAADCVLAKADSAVGQALAVGFPIGIAPPAVVDGVTGGTGEVT